MNDYTASSLSNEYRNNTYSLVLLAAVCLSALLYTGDHLYHLSMVWVAALFWFINLTYKTRSITLRFDAITIATIGYMSWLIGAYIFHPVAETWSIYTYRLMVFPFAILSAYYFIRERDMNSVLAALVIVGLIDAVITLVQAFYFGESADGFFPNRNNNAAFLTTLMLPLVSYLVFGESKIVTRIAVMGVVAIFLLSILQVSSRGVYISLAVTATLLFIFALYRRKYKNVISIIIFALLLILINYFISSVELKTDVSSPSRWLLWQSALEMLRDSSWHGIGVGMFHWIYLQYKNPDELSLGFFVHNDYLQILLELGIPGIILFLSLFVIVFIKTRRLYVQKYDGEAIAIPIGMLLAILTTMIHSLVTFNFYHTAILFVLGIYVGLLLRSTRDGESDGKHRAGISVAVPKWKLLSFYIVMTLSITPVVLKGYADGVLDGFLNEDLVKAPIEGDYRIYSELWKLDPDRYLYPISMAWSSIGMSAKLDKQARAEAFVRSGKLIAKAKHLNPYAADVYFIEAQLIRGFKDVAGEHWETDTIKALDNALKLNPGFMQVRMMKAEVLKESGRGKEAVVVLLDGLPYIHGFGNNSYYELGQFLAQESSDKYSYTLFSGLLEDEKLHNQQAFEEMLQEYQRKKATK